MRGTTLILILGFLTACVEPLRSESRTIRATPRRGVPPLEAAAALEADDTEDGRLVAASAPELLGAVEAFRAGNGQAALSRFLEIARDPLRSPGPRALAELYAAKSLRTLGLQHAAWVALDAFALRQGPLRRRALPWLALLADDVGSDAVEESLGGFSVEDVDALTDQPEPIRQRLAYLLGRRAFLAGDDSAALGVLERVTESSPDYPRTLYLRGAIHLRAHRPADAVASFAAVRAALARPGMAEADRLGDIAELARARVLFSLGGDEPAKLEEALSAYRSIRHASAAAGEAGLEAGWTLYRLERFDEALAEAEAARARLAERDAEAVELAVAARVALCRVDEAAASLSAARDHLEKIKAHISPLREAEPNEVLAKARQIHGGHKAADPEGEALAAVAHDAGMSRLFERQAAIAAERKRAKGLPLEFSDSSGGQFVKSLLARADERTGKAALAALASGLEALAAKLDEELKRFDELAADLGAARAECAKAKAGR